MKRKNKIKKEKLPEAECPCHPSDYPSCRDPRCGSPEAMAALLKPKRGGLDYPPIGGVYNL